MMYRYMIVNVSIIAEPLYRDTILIIGNELWITVSYCDSNPYLGICLR